MSSSYKWIFSEAYLGKNSDTQSYESMCNLYFKQLNTNTELNNDKYIELNSGTISGYKINDYEDIAYIDLNSVHSPDSSFTLEFSVTELDQINTTKAINYLTFGYHVRGKSGVTLTVGRPENSSNVVIGTITETSTSKAVVYDSNFPVEPNTQYDYTLTYNNFATDEEKLKLFRGPYLISTSSNFDIQNYSIVDRKLFLGSSAWTNEPSWSNVFDLSTNVVFNDSLQLHTNKVIDKSFIPSSPFYPLHYSIENITNATRNTHQIAVKDDFVEVKFHSTKDVPTNNVYMNIDGLSNNTISQTNVENPFILGNGSNTVMYTYQFQVTDSWPTDGIISYGLDMYGNVTLSNIFPEFTENMYIDNTIPTLAYTFNPPSHNNVSFTITEITDAYLDVMTNQTPFEYYTVNFYASNNTHVRSTVVNNPNINQSYFVENLDDETIYTLYATITDRANNTTERIFPSNGSEIVETVDITAPVIQYLNTATITDNAEKRPGIKVTTSTYDTATELTVNTHNYTVYISILEENISDINVVESKLTTNNLFQQLKTNFTAETIEQEMLKYYDTNNVEKDIVTEKTFYIYCLVIDNAASPNKHFTKTSHFINNTLTLTNIVSDFSTNDIAELGNTLTLTFESDFKLYDKSQFAITMMEDTVTNATSANGLNWTATNLVKNTNASGEILFSVTQTPDIDAPASLNQTDHTDSLYIQKESPVFKSGVNNTLSTGLTSLTVTNIGDYISDFTINSNNNLFKLEVTTNNETKGGVYSTKAELPSSFVFSDLDENNSYEVRASISNLFAESSDQIIGSITTQKDIPTISIETTANQITTASYPLIQLSSGSKVTEHTTPFDMYVYVADFNITDPSAIRSFLLSTTPQITNHPTGTDIDIRSLIPQDITTHLSYSAGSQTYTYIFEINVQSASTNIEIASIKANGVSLHSWDKFVSVLAFIQPNHITANDINNILVDTQLYVAWVDNILSVGDQLFQIVTTEKINTLDISPHRPLYGPGWKIYENGLVILEEVSNRGNANTPSNDGGIWYYTYVLPLNAFSQTTLIPSTTTTYYLYAMIDDTATEPVYDKKTITFDFTFTEAMLSNISYNYFVRNGDTVKMSWNTTYVSQVSDFSNVKVFGVNATPTSYNGKDWVAQVTIVEGIADHSVSYLGTPLTINASNVLYDNAAPTFTIDFVSKSTNTIQVTLDNFGSDTYTNQTVPAGVNNDYNVVFTVTKTEDNSFPTNSPYSFTVDYANLTTNNFILDGLEEAKDYTISCTLTDPAQNTITVNYDNGNSIQTSDVTVPTINSLTSTINTTGLNKEPGFYVSTTTYDNNEHTVHMSIFNYQLTGSDDDKKTTITTNSLSTDTITTINANVNTSNTFGTYFKTSDTTQYAIRTEETYYIYCVAVDIDGNFFISNNVKTIDNTFSNPSIVTNFSKNDIAEVGNDIIVSFTTDYRLFTDQIQVTMMGDSITPVSSDNGLTWTATNTVTSSHTSGKVIFSVSQTLDIGSTTSSFDDTSLDAVYIQKENPSFFTLPVTNNIHNIVVTLDSGKYVFTPSISSFINGHTYIFDNTGASTNSFHPLRFTSSSTHPGLDSPTILFKDDVNHIIVVTITDSSPGPIYAHCGFHSGMGSVVNGVSGIPITTLTDVSFGSLTNEIVISNIGTNINDFTINSNNDLLQLTVELGGQTITNTYANKSLIPNSFTFANLTENTQYEVKASISNLFSESNNIVLGNANTTFDFPSITVNANVSTLDDEPVVQLLTTSLATESTSAFDIYIEVTDFLFTDNTEVSTFKELLQAKLTDTSPGTNIYYVSQLDTNKLSTYWSRNGTAFVNNPLIPSTTLQYYVYAIIDDHVHIIHNRADVTFSFTASQASLSNTSYPYFTRNDDVVNMAWSTTLKSQASDFTNIKIFDQTPTPPVTTDYLNWSTSVTLPPSGVPVGNHSITYLNTSLTVNSDNVLFDNAAPTFDIVLDSTTETTFNFKLTNLGSDVYTNQVIPITGVDNTYSVVFKATHTDATLIEKTFTNITHTNLTIYTFTVDGLLEGGAYSIEATLTDPAANTKTVAYNQGNLVITNDTTLPVITNVDTLLTHVASQTIVTAVDIKAYDTHSIFDIYGGLFTTNTIDFDIQSLKDNSNTQSVIFSKTNQPTSSYVSLSGTFEKVLSYNGSSWVTNDFEYNRDYYMYIGVEDASGNINSNNGVVFQTVTMNNGPTTSYFDPTTGTFIDPTEDGQAPQETTTTDITQDAQSALVFQPVVATDPNVDTTTDTTTYAAYDTSGNNNNIYFDAATNPLSTNAIINDYSVNIGLTTTGLALSSSLSIAGDDGFTYITHVNNTNDVFDDTVLLQNAGNDFLTVSDTGITINTGTVVFFPVSLLTNEWNSVSVSTENNTVRVFVNGEEILPTPETANNYNSAQATGTLTIPPQQNILIDGITVFNTPINAAIIETVVSSGEFKIKLDFENPPIQSFDVSYSNSKFYLNNEVSPELVFNSNAYYTFLQSSSNGIPLILSETGTFPVPNTDNLNVSYFINNVNIGNDPLQYSLEFATNNNNKVVLHTDNTSNLFYHSTTDLEATKITVSQVAFKGIQNVANTSEAAQPVYTMTPVFTTDTKSGNHAMVFDAAQQTALTFNNFTLDANNMTMSAWVKTDFTQQSNNPLISQEGVFEFGIDETGKSYFKLFNNDTPGNYATIDAVTMEDSKINISNMAFTTDMTNPGYVYAVATANKRDKSTIMSMMDTHKYTENVYYRAITTEASIPSIDLTKMFDVTDIIQDTKTMNQAYVYVSIRENNNYALGVVNQYNEYKVSFSNTVPRMHINGFSNLNVEGVQSLQIFDGTISSGTASIDKYYTFSILQNDDGTVGADSLEMTEDLANTFINSTSFTTHFDANVANGAIYLNDTNISKNTVGTITNATVTKAFNSVTDATDLSSVHADSNYSSSLVGVDSLGRIGVGINAKVDPFADAFRTSTAIADLTDGIYSSSDTLTFGDITVSGMPINDGRYTYDAGSFQIQTDSNNKRYFSLNASGNTTAFGPFNLGFTDFTMVFVISYKNLSKVDRLTYGVYPIDKINIHISPTFMGLYDAEYGYTTSQVSSSQLAEYASADYLLKIVSYNHSTSRISVILRTNTTNNHNEFTISHTYPTEKERAIVLSESGEGHRIYEMMIFPGEYMTSDRSTYPLFGIIEDYVASEYGIHVP